MEEFIKNNGGERKPENYFNDPGEAYFEGLSSKIKSRITPEPKKTKHFGLLVRTTALAAMVLVVLSTAIYLYHRENTTTAAAEEATEEEIYLDAVANEIDLDEDMDIIVNTSTSNATIVEEDELQELDDEDVEEIYNEIINS